MGLGEELVEMKLDRFRGDISREKYWETVAGALLSAESVAGLLLNGTEVRIDPVVICYPFSDPVFL